MSGIAAGASFAADHLDLGVGQTGNLERVALRIERLVENADGVAVAQRAVGKTHEYRIAVVNDADAVIAARRERVGHDRADQHDDDGIEHRARAHADCRRPAGPAGAVSDVDVGIVGDQTRRPADLRHHRVASVDAQPALDAAEIGTAADIDAGRTDVHALQAIDAVAGRLAVLMQRRGLLQRGARLAAIVTIGDVERVFVGQGRLDARPRAHIDADLLAHPAGQRVGRET